MTRGQADLWDDHERAAWRAPARMTVSEWADRYRWLPRSSAEPGRWRTARVPYAREWMDNANLSWVEQTTLLCSTQVGKTETLNNVVGYAIDQRPGTIVFGMPRKEDAKYIGEDRLSPMIESSPQIARHVTTRKHDWTKQRIRFDRCTLYLRAAQSPSDFASVAAMWLIGDEAKSWPDFAGKEAPPWHLALERQRTFYTAKAYLASTALYPDTLIHKEFRKGDQRRYWVPCPHCAKFQVLRWQQVKFGAAKTAAEMEEQRTAYYECEHCEQEIHDQHKQRMLQDGRWVPDGIDLNQCQEEQDWEWVWDRRPHRSYHLWAAYSPWLQFWQIARKFLEAQEEGLGALMNFVTNWLAEPWEEKLEEPKASMLEQATADYARGQVPDGVELVTATVDVQKRFLTYTVRGWSLQEESWLLDHGRVDDFEELENRLWLGPVVTALPLTLVLLDSRHRFEECTELAYRYPHQVRLLQGVWTPANPAPYTVVRLEKHPETHQPLEGSLVLLRVNVGKFKDLLASRLARGGDGARAFHIYPEAAADENYSREMQSEQKVRKRVRGQERELWVQKPGHKANHFWDVEVYQQAAATVLAIARLNVEGTAARKRPVGIEELDELEEEGRPSLWRMR